MRIDIEQSNKKIIAQIASGSKNIGTNNLKESQVNYDLVQKYPDYLRWNDAPTTSQILAQLNRTRLNCRTVYPYKLIK